MQRRRLIQAIAAIPALSRARAAGTELVVGVNQTTIESAPLLVQKLSGIRVVPFISGRAASAQLVEGKLDAATGNETQATLNAAKEPSLRIVLTLAEARYRIVARRSSGIRQMADLRGKRIAYTATTASEYFLMDSLSWVGLTLADVTLVGIEASAMPPAFGSGRIDAMATWEPEPQNALALLGDDGIVLTDSRPSAYVARFNLNTTTTVLDDPARRAVLVQAIRAIADVSRKLTVSPQSCLPSLARSIDTPVGTIEKAWPRFRFPASLDAKGLLATLKTMEPWAAGAQKRTPRSDAALASIIDDSVAREAGVV